MIFDRIVFCFLGSFFLSEVFIVEIFLILPAEDGAKQSGIISLIDPFVLTIQFLCCISIAVISIPFVLLGFHERKNSVMFPATLMPMTLAIIVTTPFLWLWSIPVACCVGLVSMIVARGLYSQGHE